MREVLRQEGQGGEQRKARLERFGERARGQKPGEGGQGQNQPGKGQGSLELKLGRGSGGDIPIPGTQSGSQGSPGSPGESQASSGEKGQGVGQGHGEGLKGDRSRLDAQTHEVSAAGIDSGEGTASAEVIYGAAQRGFVGKGYKDIFTEYQSVAEQVIEKDEIPPGYRFYVRRYFQLIRPRE
jgi:hypothetical protein